MHWLAPKFAKMKQHGRNIAKVGPREANDEQKMPRRWPKWTKMPPRAKTEPSKNHRKVGPQELRPGDPPRFRNLRGASWARPVGIHFVHTKKKRLKSYNLDDARALLGILYPGLAHVDRFGTQFGSFGDNLGVSKSVQQAVNKSRYCFLVEKREAKKRGKL